MVGFVRKILLPHGEAPQIQGIQEFRETLEIIDRGKAFQKSRKIENFNHTRLGKMAINSKSSDSYAMCCAVEEDVIEKKSLISAASGLDSCSCIWYLR